MKESKKNLPRKSNAFAHTFVRSNELVILEGMHTHTFVGLTAPQFICEKSELNKVQKWCMRRRPNNT